MSRTRAHPSVLAVVISFNPAPELLANSLGRLVAQGCDCMVVDNGSSPEVTPDSLPAKVTLHKLNDNLGLGAAQNVGIEYALDQGYDYVLLLDQDSQPSITMVARLIAAHQAKSVECNVAAVGPIYRNVRNQSESFFIRFAPLKFKRLSSRDKDSDHCVETDFLISSGSLFATEVFTAVGMMNEDLFIDHVDTEWFLRAKTKRFTSFGVCDAVMEHNLGESTHTVNLAGRERNVPQHKPFRYYYIFRNSVLLYKRPGLSRLWKWNDLQRLVMIGIMFAVLTPPRVANLRMMLKGMWHGLLGRAGKLDTQGSQS